MPIDTTLDTTEGATRRNRGQPRAKKSAYLSRFCNVRQRPETDDIGLWLRRARVRVPSVTFLLILLRPISFLTVEAKRTSEERMPAALLTSFAANIAWFTKRYYTVVASERCGLLRVTRVAVSGKCMEAVTMEDTFSDFEEKKAFYAKLFSALGECGFVFSAKDFRSHNWLELATETAAPIVEAVGMIANIDGVTVPEVRSRFNAEGVDQALDNVRGHVDAVCFKFTLYQPVVAALIEADYLNDDDKKTAFERFDQAMASFRDFTASMSGTKGSVTGLLLWCFFEAKNAEEFCMNLQNHLRKSHFWKKRYTLSWVIDVERGVTRRHKGLPILVGKVFDADKFDRHLFA
jgi:hypothetical protein